MTYFSFHGIHYCASDVVSQPNKKTGLHAVKKKKKKELIDWLIKKKINQSILFSFFFSMN